MRKPRSQRGSIAAEHLAAMIVLFLGLLFPLCNIATSFLRYGMVLQSVNNGAHYGATAQTWSKGSSTQAVMDLVPGAVLQLCNQIKGVKNPVVAVRMLETQLSNGNVTRLGDSAKLVAPQPKPGFIYTVETTLDCDIEPLVPFQGGLVPHVPGMTSSYHAKITTRQLLENPDGMKT